MPYNRPLTLKVANPKDFGVLHGALFILVVIAAVLSPQPFLLTIFASLFFGAGWVLYTLDYSKVNDVKSILVLFPDGRVKLESGQMLKIEGFLSGQQWCIHHLAVLRYTAQGKHHYVVLLSAQQRAEEFRRLRVLLRQDYLLLKSEGRV